MTLNSNQTVREIAINNPQTVRIFESLGIDYCCGGKRPLREACELAKVPLERAIELLAAVELQSGSLEERSWSGASLAELTGHIVQRYHRSVREESPRLALLLEKVVNRHGGAHPELRSIQDLFGALSHELFAHMLKEEQVLFPYLQKMEAAASGAGVRPEACFGSVEFPIARMLADHDDAGELLARMRELSGQYQAPQEACPSYRGLYHGLQEFERDLHQHIHLENNILFPRAVEIERELQETENARA
jgi:regulator of cell morphogenesis and NO signaling